MFMKATGKMIAWMVKVVFLCQMVQFSKVNFKTENFTVMVYTAGLMDQNMKVWNSYFMSVSYVRL